MGIRYAMFRSELIISTASSTTWCVSAAPRARNHLLHVLPAGGRPITLSAPIAKQTIVMGMERPSPRMSLISVLCVAT